VVFGRPAVPCTNRIGSCAPEKAIGHWIARSRSSTGSRARGRRRTRAPRRGHQPITDGGDRTEQSRAPRQQHQQGDPAARPAERRRLGHVGRGRGLAARLPGCSPIDSTPLRVDDLVRERAVVGREPGVKICVHSPDARRARARDRRACVCERVERERVHHGVERLGSRARRTARCIRPGSGLFVPPASAAVGVGTAGWTSSSSRL
jgi:hypothetical protein